MDVSDLTGNYVYEIIPYLLRFMTTTDDRPLSQVVVEAIADAEDVTTGELEYAVHDYVDLEELDAFVTNSDSAVSVTVAVAEHTVQVESEGPITVDGAEYRWQPC